MKTSKFIGIALMAICLGCAFPLKAQTDSVAVVDEEPVFVVVEQDPQYPGGYEAMYKFLASNIVYPKQAKENGVTGKVFVSFVIEKDGSVTNVKLVRDPGCGLGEEAVRVVKMMPRWKPGMQRGTPVRTQFMLPINFELQGEEPHHGFFYRLFHPKSR